MVRLGVNVDHVATLRQVRGTLYPDPIDVARICEQAGAGGITAHLREDRRHIQDEDVQRLKETLHVPLNLEMANTAEMVQIALKLLPAEVCLVPERREERTTEGGLDVLREQDEIAFTVKQLQTAGIEVSLFVAPEPAQIQASFDVGALCVELHTGTFCDAAGMDADDELKRLINAARQAHQLGLKVNAGHGIHLGNIRRILQIPHLDTLNIGHSIISHAVFVGIGRAVQAVLESIQQGSL